MGLLKRMIRRTSHKLLASIGAQRGSHQLAPSHHQYHCAPTNILALNTSNANALMEARMTRKSGKRARKSSSKRDTIPEALLVAAKNHLPPVQFHHVHGPNAQLSKNKLVARRTQNFCQALVFSNRVILPNERVYIKVLEIAKGWSGTIRFGFTAVDPATLRYHMPKHACPDMTNAGHTWARALADEVVRRNSVIHFSYNTNGYIHYGINNQDCGLFHANVKTNQNLWFIVDIYGLTASVELIDPRIHNNSLTSASELDFTQLDDELRTANSPLPQAATLANTARTFSKSTSAMNELHHHALAAAMAAQARATSKHNKRSSRNKATSRNNSNNLNQALYGAGAAHWPAGSFFVPAAAASAADYHRAAAAVAAATQIGPVLPNLNSVVLSAQQNIYSPMPGTLQQQQQTARTVREAPHDYYHILSDTTAASGNQQATQSTLDTSASSSSSSSSRLARHLDASLNISSDTTSSATTSQPTSTRGTRHSTAPVAAVRRRLASHKQAASSSTQVAASTANDTATSSTNNTHSHNNAKSSSNTKRSLVSTRFRLANSSPNKSSRQSIKNQKSTSSAATATAATSSSANRDNNQQQPASKDCPICFEGPINCVLYQCGHMCTCYECGVKQWKHGSKTCPICRTVIRDVIKTYMS